MAMQPADCPADDPEMTFANTALKAPLNLMVHLKKKKTYKKNQSQTTKPTINKINLLLQNKLFIQGNVEQILLQAKLFRFIQSVIGK